MRVGKYRGRLFTEIEQSDRSYCAWILRSEPCCAGFAKFARYLRQLHGGILEMGKHKGLWFDEVLAKEPDYCIWAMRLKEPSAGFHKFIIWLRVNFDTTTEEEAEEHEPPNKKVKQDDECKICCDKLVDSVFIPCGHILACLSCALSVERCPICKTPCGAIRTYRA